MPTRRQVLLAAAASGLKGAAERNMTDDLKAGIPALVNAPTFRGQLDRTQVEALLRHQNLSREELMLSLLAVAKQRAHPPISNYFVGAAALGRSGSMYLGQNIEIAGGMLGLSVHAEQSAIANAYMSGESAIEAIAVTAAPCGHCRQFLSEACFDKPLRILIADAAPILLSELLPHSFGPRDLGLDRGVFPVRRIAGKLKASKEADDLTQLAFQAACGAYSPYSKSRGGVAIMTASQRIFAGSYIENAAFNPSLPPLQAALAGYYAAGTGAGTIERAVLVESDHGAISHEAGTRMVLSYLAPQANFERVMFLPM